MKKQTLFIIILTIVFIVALGKTVNQFGSSKSKEPSFKAGDCVAYWMYGKRFEAKEEWETSRDIPAFMSLEILKVGKEKYLVNTHYSKSSPAPFRPNEGYPINRVDEDFELINCKEIDSILE